MEKDQIISMVNAHHALFKALAGGLNRLNLKNRFRHRAGCTLKTGVSFFKGVKIDNQGKNNRIVIGDFCRLTDCSVIFHGDGNTLTLGDFVTMNGVSLYMEDDGNTIEIGNHNNFCGTTHLDLIEGTKITIGRDCLFSGALQFRTGDSHSILDLNGKRINPSKDIRVGNHVWIGSQVNCLKGTIIPDHCVVGSGSTLCKAYEQENCILAGVPAKIVKTGITWDTQRLPIE